MLNAIRRARYRRRLRKAIDRVTWRGLWLVGGGVFAFALNDRHAWNLINAKAERDLHAIELLENRLKGE
jgi:hypothetical protein